MYGQAKNKAGQGKDFIQKENEGLELKGEGDEKEYEEEKIRL